jgi:hypothetical protein
MENAVPYGWSDLDLNELIMISKNEIRIAWIGSNLSSQELLIKCNELGLKARQLKVGTREVWQHEIENDGNVVDYHDGKGNPASVMYDLSAVPFTLKEYGDKYGAEYSKKPKYRSKTRDILVSAFDTLKNKRVIVDGIHRGAVMSSKYSDDSDFSNRIVYEWYGDKVKEIFTFDFNPFYRNNTRKVPVNS